MKVTLEKLPASQVCFEVEVEGEKSQVIYDRIVKDLVRSMNIPGFRKGKAPKQLVLREAGVDRLKANVMEELLEQTLSQALKDQKDHVQAIGSFELLSPFDQMLSEFVLGQSFSFKAAIDVHPEVKLSKYQGLTVKAEKIEPDLTRVDKTLHEYQVKNSTLVPVEEDRGVEIGDVVTIDIKVLDQSGVEIAEATENDVQTDIQEDRLMPELVQGLLGVKVDETKEIALTLPEDYYIEGYAGEPATFVVVLKGIKARELPALDDDFAQSISEKATIEELREFLTTRITDESDDKTEANADKALLDALVAEIEVDLPSTLIRDETTFLIQQQANYIQNLQGGDKLFKQLFTREFVEQMRQMNEPEAISRLKRTLALAEIAKLESLAANPDEIAVRVAEVQESLDEPADPERIKQVVADEIAKEKVMEWLKQKSEVEYVSEGSLQPEPELDSLESEAVVAEIEPEIELASEDPEVIEVEAVAAESEPEPEPVVEPKPSKKAASTKTSKKK